MILSFFYFNLKNSGQTLFQLIAKRIKSIKDEREHRTHAYEGPSGVDCFEVIQGTYQPV